MTSDQKAILSFGQDIVAGAVSGVVSKSATAPVERIKLLLQTQSINTTIKASQRYSGPIDCVIRVYREQGVLSFWRGNIANCLRYIPNAAITFAFNDRYREIIVGSSNSRINAHRFLLGNFISGGLAGGTALLVTYPLDMARTRLATDNSVNKLHTKYNGTFDCIYKVYQENGVVKGVYSGLKTAFIGAIIFKSLFLGGYEIIKVISVDKKFDDSAINRLLIAQIVTSLSGTICYPLDTIKRRMMMSKHIDPTTGLPFYQNGYQCLKYILKYEGLSKGLFAGLSVNLVRGMSGPFLLVGYDYLKFWLKV